MGLKIGSAVEGRNSTAIRNSPLSPAKLVMLEQQGTLPLAVEFDIVGHAGQFTDTTIAQYATYGNSSLEKYVRANLWKLGGLPKYFKGELTTAYTGVQGKRISFDIIYHADVDLPPSKIRKNVITLQSMCYPRKSIALNPPLCTLHILNLYSLEVYVEQVLVNWHNRWMINSKAPRDDQGLPMGCDIAMTCLMHQYPTRDDILCGAGFDSTNFVGSGYSGSFQQQSTTLTHDHDCIANLITKDTAYNNTVRADSAAANLAQRVSASNRKLYEDPANLTE